MTKNRILAALLAIVMVFGLVCTGTAPVAKADAEPRTLYIGVWWDIYYDSTHESPEDAPYYAAKLNEDMAFENVKKIEEKYNVRFEYVNMTFEGVKESINTSILAGTPDCDIYLCDLQFGVPAALNGLCVDLKTVLPEDADILSEQKILNYLDLGNGQACLFKGVSAENVLEATWPLAFNIQMLEDNNLEDPRELYARGEWTWDKFVEYCQVLTQDTDGDGITDQFGMTGFSKDILSGLLMSNGATIASSSTQTLDAPATLETIEFYTDLYHKYNVCDPYTYDQAWDVMRWTYRNGNVGFWPTANWIASQNADYDHDGLNGYTLEFDTAFVDWPVGPSGSQETNRAKRTAGNYYMIPNGAEDPALIYEVFEAITNWYDGDVELRDDPDTLSWWYTVSATDEDLQQANYDCMFSIGSRDCFDLWDSVGVEMDLNGLIDGYLTPSQLVEQYKQEYQAALDAFFG